jgi:hypothetical protein
MVEVTVQLTSKMSDSVREIANKQFEGSLPAVLNAASELYLNIQTRKREQLKKVVQQIRQEVEAQGGIDEEDLEHRIKEYRRTKYSKPL